MLSSDEKALELSRHFFRLELPFGLFLVAKDGRFLECNIACREMLALPQEGPIRFVITDFHRDPNEWQKLVLQAENADAQGKFVESAPFCYRISGKEIFVRQGIHALRNGECGQFFGYIGFMFDVTKEQRYQRLFNHLPVGLYRLDAQDVVVNINDALVQILGFKSKDEIINRPVRDFYVYPEDVEILREAVKKEGKVVKEVRKLVKKNGELIYASISSVAIKGPDDKYEGREGTLIDVTKDERYRRSLQGVPVGFYEVRVENEKDIILHCNPEFARMFDFDSQEQVIGLDIRQLYAEPNDHTIFLRELHIRDAQGLPLLGYPLRVRTCKGREFVIEVNSRPLKDRNGKIVGRTGVVRDISKEQQLREEIRSLQSDIGKVLHAYTATLLMTRHAVLSAIESFGPYALVPTKVHSTDEIDRALIDPVKRLTTSLQNLLKIITLDWQEREISQENWNELSSLLQHLQNFRDRIPIVEFRPHTLRLLACQVNALCDRMQEAKLPKESLKRIIRDATYLERLICIAYLRKVEAEIIAMDHHVRGLRDFVTTGARPEEEPRSIRLWDLVAQAMSNLEEYAQRCGVNFEPKDDSNNAYVMVVERDMLRALSNLLHNAIKYSWSREKGKSLWVTIHAYIVANFVCVMFENYGVPIPSDEIEQGLIFKFGYRGRLSTDRGRLGTGIGLTDALNTAKHYGGNIIAESTPARRDFPLGDYKVPYLTRITISLPLLSQKGDGQNEEI